MTRRRLAFAYPVATFLVALLFLAPLVAMLTGSFRQPGLPPPRTVELIPNPATTQPYRDAVELAPLGRALLNSALVAAMYVPLAVLASSWAGFAIAHASPRSRRRLTIFVLMLFMVPATAVWLTRFVLFKQAGLVDTYWPLVLPALLGGSPFAVLLFAFSFRRVPAELYDAARVEGLRPLAVWRRVAMPLVRGTTIAVAMLAFIATWSSFIDPLLYLSTQERFTAPLVLRYLEQLGPTNWPVLLAGSVLVAAPVVVVFLIAQRYFLQPERGAGWLGR